MRRGLLIIACASMVASVVHAKAKAPVDLDQALDEALETEEVAEDERQPVTQLLDPGQLEAMRATRLEEEVQLSLELIALNGDNCESAPPVLFRLGDLYWEKSKRAFFMQNDMKLSEEERAVGTRSMAEYQGETVRWYKQIVEQCPDYENMAKVLYYLGRTLTEMDRSADGAVYFKQLIQNHSESDWAASGWFMIGEYFFNVESDVEQAMKAYERVHAYQSTRVYPFAVYKEGWCHINEGSWELALRRFKKVIDLTATADGVLEEAARQGLRVEALRDYVRAFSNIDPQYSVAHLGRPEDAWKNFSTVGGADEVLGMVEALGTLYRSRDAHDKAVRTYRLLSKMQPESHRLAVWQAWVLLATSRSSSRKTILREIDRLKELLDASRARERQNPLVDRDRKKARVDAERSSEEVLRKLAVTQHREARRLRGKARARAYRFASTLYDAYLNLFAHKPREVEVDYGFYVRFYRGELLVQLDRPLEAAESFMAALDRAPKKPTPQEHKLIRVSAEEGVRAYDRVLRKAADGQGELKGQVGKKFLDASERYLALVTGPLDRFTLDILYRTGRIHYETGDLTRAKSAFNTVVTKGKRSPVACFAANLLLDIYNGEGDFDRLEEEARRFSNTKGLGCKRAEQREFAKIAEQAAFKRVRERVGKDGGDLAEAYLEFHRRYGDSDLADDALYNAALEVEKQGDDAQAKALRQELIDTYPTSELTREALYDEAKNAELLADFEQASQRLELFAKRFADDERASAALSDATAYRDALGDTRRAARNRERLVTRYSTDEQAHWVYAEMCEGMRKRFEAREGSGSNPTRSEWWKLDACYHGYLTNRALSSREPDLTCLMRHRRAQLLGSKLGAVKAAGAQRDKMMALWESLAGGEIGERRRCSAARAEMLFTALDPAWKAYKRMVLSVVDPSSSRAIEVFRKSVTYVTKTREEINRRYEEIVQLGSQTWSLAALYRIGESYFATVDKLLTAPVSAALAASPEDVALVRQQLGTEATPLIEVGAKMLEDCRRVSHETGVYNRWVVKAIETLRFRLPGRHPPVREVLPRVVKDLGEPKAAVLWVPTEQGGLRPLSLVAGQSVVSADSAGEGGR